MTYGRIRRGPMAGDAFTQIRNTVFRDPRLSAKAMGIFGNISTHRDGWGITPESISTQMRDGVNAIKAGLRELEQYGYLQRERERRPDGTLGSSTYFITDQPEVIDGSEQNRRSEPTDDFPPVEKPTVDQPTVDDRPHKKTIPLVKKISSEEKTTSSPAEPVEPEPAADGGVTDGGGGGSHLRSIAEHITASLDYQGQVPDKQQRERITVALVAVLKAGWDMAALAAYLNPGSFRPGNPAAFYLAKLTKNLPDAVPPPPSAPVGGVRGRVLTGAEVEELTVEDVLGGGKPAQSWDEALANVRAAGSYGGTDANMAAHFALRDQLAAQDTRKAPHTPYSNDGWREPATPEQMARKPWCGHPDCEPGTRLKDGQMCADCHAGMDI